MNDRIMTLECLASYTDVERLVGNRHDRRWGRASLTSRRSDGHSTASWFDEHKAEKRIQLVRASLLHQQSWSALWRIHIPKGPSSLETRAVDMPVVLDQARLYRIHDCMNKHAETVLTRVAVAYRSKIRMERTILGAHERMKALPFASVIDIKAFFDSIEWARVDRVIEELPADRNVMTLLRDLIRIEVLDRRSGSLVERRQGVPQGLSVSGTFANLALADFDKGVAHAISRLGGVVRRYCDDILVQASSMAALVKAVAIIGDRLAHLGLRVREGTARMIDTRTEPIDWLGISFGPEGLGVPPRTIENKVAELQEEVEHGLIGLDGIEDSLVSLYQHYRPIISQECSQKVIASIRGRLDLANLPNNRKENQKQTRTLIDIRRTVDLKPSRELQEGSRTETTKLDEMTPPGNREGQPIPGTSGNVSMLAAPTAESSGANGPGTPARSVPAAVEKREWRIGAIARGPRRAHVVARETGGGSREQWQVDFAESTSAPEAATLALADGLTLLRTRGAEVVTIVVTDATLRGYVWHGWRPRSLAMHSALTSLIEAASDLDVRLEPHPRAAAYAPQPTSFVVP